METILITVPPDGHPIHRRRGRGVRAGLRHCGALSI